MGRKDLINSGCLVAVLLMSGCGSSSDTPNGDAIQSIAYTDITTTSGFSSAYLSNKTFFRPQSNPANFIQTKTFTTVNVSWDDNLFNISGNAAYSIVSSNGINGVIEYDDGGYILHYNLHSVEADHIKVCYTYQGIGTVANCNVADAHSWYFDRTTAESNYP